MRRRLKLFASSYDWSGEIEQLRAELRDRREFKIWAMHGGKLGHVPVRGAGPGLGGGGAAPENPEHYSPDQTSHGPVYGSHEHAHPAHGADDADAKGMHIHLHTHKGDPDHAHEHAQGEDLGDIRTGETFGRLDRGRQEAILEQEKHRAIPTMAERAAMRNYWANRL